MVLSGAAVVLGAVAVYRAFLPPQTRALYLLTGRVEDLEAAHEDLRARLTKRAQRENMDKARSAHEERALRRDQIEAQAAEIIEAAKNQPAAPQSPADLKIALRQRLRLGAVK